MVIITSKPATVSNKNPFTFGFNCRETCSFECSVRQRGINPSYSPCNSNRFKASNLQNGKTYVFYVRGTDDVGNQGNPASYTWKVGESILTGLKKINFTFLLVTTKLVTGGGEGVENIVTWEKILRYQYLPTKRLPDISNHLNLITRSRNSSQFSEAPHNIVSFAEQFTACLKTASMTWFCRELSDNP